jgi:O-succinylbenzoic acid--CoA ligase
MKPGEVGTIHVKGPMVMSGYLDRPSENARRFRDNWFDTGDFGSLDSSGFLTVITRRDDLIISGGENVYPAEVEAVLTQFPGVREAAVFGLPDIEWGQIVATAIVVDSQVSPTELTRWISGKIASFKTPRVVFTVEELPRTASGKVQSHKLREMFAPSNLLGTS